MFKKLFKKNAESTKNVKEVVVPCVCDGDNEHCDLILQLRKYQDLRKEIKDEIEILNKSGQESLAHTIRFLEELEANGFHMNRLDRWVNCESNIFILEAIIDKHSSGDIFRMAEELKTYRNKTDIICEKQRALKAVEDDIKKIKSKLGIE